ncbi:DUF5052 family protein [Acidaminobacter hydrogenoformans]|uniref:DUF5052 domain-containing protein n=1 Tax=Acidaminobacter hydrogenoformans DSM 2784 TaxID=1120920 RepID=A0A1G5RVG8_9FIRM|nr:DUF5052 family protein [Acidaminobacter hydrogenoformans]SCZ78135.1 protein of unknown function [Acidaminobacter hydrogenoformans DSM 2784]
MKRKIIALLTLVVILAASAAGCAGIRDAVAKIKGDLVGQKFVISVYDDYADKTLEVTGSKITVGLLENSSNFDVENPGFESEVIEITVNGNQMFQVGNTVIFAETGLDMVKDYAVPTQASGGQGGGFVPFDRYVNDIKNQIGKDKTIIISSQMGIPIGVFQGKDVYVTVPEDLPKMTRLNIDGKSLYIHRANYVIMDSEMLD